MKNKLKISIGTTAFNEQQNIQNTLKTVINQKEDKTFTISEILVISDGSTDKTVEKAFQINDKRVKISSYKNREGQPTRINEILRIFKGDILILIDSDMIMRDKFAVKNIISPFSKKDNIGFVTGNTTPYKPQNFLESAINNYRYARLKFMDEFDFGKSAYSAHSFLAYSRKFGKSLHISKDIMNYDAFSYFSCLSMGYCSEFVKNAITFYRSPQSLRDHINQSTRHLAGGLQLEKIFGSHVVKKRFFIPNKILIKMMLYQLLRNPLGYILLKLLNFYCSYKSKSILKNINIKWEPIKSSKSLPQKY